jgi:hypothetical protein
MGILSLKINNDTLSKTFVKSTFINCENPTLALTETSITYVLFTTTALECSNTKGRNQLMV